jgi:DNA excision repair protein ERCC-3
MGPRKRGADEDEEYVDEGDDYDIPIGGERKKGKRGAGPKSAPTSLGPLEDPEVIFHDYSKSLTLKRDHINRPCWITPGAHIFLEAFSQHYQGAYDFLVAIGEPVSRPKFIHEYRLTEDSLYAAVALGIDTDKIIKTLNRLCKTDVPAAVVTYIRNCTYTFGKAKLVLKDNRFYVESQFPEVLRELLKNPTIRNARWIETAPSDAASGSGSTGIGTDGFVEATVQDEDKRNLKMVRIDDGDDDDDLEDDEEEALLAGGIAAIKSKRTVSFMVKQKSVQTVKKSAKEESKYPLMEEYDFKADRKNPNLGLDLKPSTRIRSYQEKSLAKMFGNGRARSGIIVLPCGAGKSLTGVTAASTIKKNTMVMCINNASVMQWRDEFLNWTTISKDSLKIFTSQNKDMLPPINRPGVKNQACVCISTYSMMCHNGKRSASGDEMIRAIGEREWGCMILDEVHVAPADMFQKVLQMVNAHCKLGLTATLVREDNKIRDLHFLVGPKLYEANWIDLTEMGFLAKVKCVEVWCPMTKEFYSEYIRGCISGGTNSRVQRLLYVMNPTKVRTCEYLVRYHVKRGDKIIIFSDDVPALILYCQGLQNVYQIPYIFGGTPEHERRKWLQTFKSSPECNCIGLSKVGDTALDIPEANVIIQVSSQFGARRQEAQRLGRILRPKHNPTGGYNAFFYSLVSSDTREMFFSTKRQQYLIDQGYTFQVIQDLADRASAQSVTLKTKKDEADLLHSVLKFDYSAVDAEEEQYLNKARGYEVEDTGGGPVGAAAVAQSVGAFGSSSGSSRVGGADETSGEDGAGTAKRSTASMINLTGLGDGTVYTEFADDKRRGF